MEPQQGRLVGQAAGRGSGHKAQYAGHSSLVCHPHNPRHCSKQPLQPTSWLCTSSNVSDEGILTVSALSIVSKIKPTGGPVLSSFPVRTICGATRQLPGVPFVERCWGYCAASPALPSGIIPKWSNSGCWGCGGMVQGVGWWH